MTLPPRVVVVTRRTELEELLDRHGTRGQADFFLRTRGRDLGGVQADHDRLGGTAAHVLGAIPRDWRRARVDRADLDRFAFSPEDVVVVVGRDGLVANVAKYLTGQPVIGVDADPDAGGKVLARHPAERVGGLLTLAASDTPPVQPRTMVEATTDDGQRLVALNEIYVGDVGHQSARWRLVSPARQAERQSCSGLLVGSGTGATGWLASVWSDRRCELPLPSPTSEQLAWCVREAWPSPTTGTTLTQGLLAADETLQLHAESERLVVFGDGIEHDALSPSWGMRITVGRADEHLNLVIDR